MAMEFYDDNHGYAAGGLLEQEIMGVYWETHDGGKTWQNQTVLNQYGNDISFPDATNGYATAFATEGDSTLLVYQ